jgi:hypothetical protein
MAENIMVFDCDGHIIESIPDMVSFLDPVDREIALRPSRNRQGPLQTFGRCAVSESHRGQQKILVVVKETSGSFPT